MGGVGGVRQLSGSGIRSFRGCRTARWERQLVDLADSAPASVLANILAKSAWSADQRQRWADDTPDGRVTRRDVRRVPIDESTVELRVRLPAVVAEEHMDRLVELGGTRPTRPSSWPSTRPATRPTGRWGRNGCRAGPARRSRSVTPWRPRWRPARPTGPASTATWSCSTSTRSTWPTPPPTPTTTPTTAEAMPRKRPTIPMPRKRTRRPGRVVGRGRAGCGPM